MSTVTISASLQKNEKIFVSSVPSNGEPTPPFCCIGINEAYPSSMKGYPRLFEVFSEMPQKGHWLFWTLAMNRNLQTNTACFTPQGRRDIERTFQGYKALKELQLVQRIQRSQYMINPQVTLPQRGHYLKALDPWMTLLQQNQGEETL